MSTPKYNLPTFSVSKHFFRILISLFLAALLFTTGCSQMEEVAEQTEQQKKISDCDSKTDNFDEDWPRIVEKQRERASHKALAYAKSTVSSCFIWGYSFDYDSRQKAAKRALSECRKFKAEAEENGNPYGECTLYSVNGERQ